MKLIIQIPCLNEEKTLPLVLKELPDKIEGIDEIEVVVIDDGSVDNTAGVAKSYGATLIRCKKNLGLGIAFNLGLEYALSHGADILVNTDGDNQYPSRYIPDLIKPILDNQADLVIGDRTPWKLKHFSLLKRFFHYFGSYCIRKLTSTDVPDVVSGFRAYSKEAMYALNLITKFSYVLDTIMQFSINNTRIVSVPIKTNLPTRESRLFKNVFQYVYKSGTSILRLYVIYRPFKSFLAFSLTFFIPGFMLGLRFLMFFLQGQGQGHIQSLIATAILILISVILFALGIIAELLKINRTLAEKELNYLRKWQYGRKQDYSRESL